MVYDILLGLATPDENITNPADVNKDGVVTSADISMIYDILLQNTD